MDFLDRTEERERLTRLLDGRTGEFACLYGRRRCGKTRLLKECVRGRSAVVYYLADRSERSSQIARFAKEASVVCPALAAAATTGWGPVLDLWMAVSPKGAILILDEFPYLVEKDPSLPSVLQRIVDGLGPTGRKIVICGSSQRMMQGLVLKASEPLYGRAKEILPVLPLGFEWLAKAFPKMSAAERLAAWGVWGGVPRYWELQEGEPDVWSAVRRHVTSPLGVLRNEPQYLLQDDVGDVAQASTVLSFIGTGAHRVSEIAGRMNRPATDLARPLQRLLELGLICRETPFGAEERGKKAYYRIADPFLDFWYTFVWPNWSREDFLATAAERAAFSKAFRPHLGLVWERQVRHDLARSWRKVSRWWGAGANRRPMELDVVAESPDGETLLVGEAKLSLTKTEAAHVRAELKAKAALLPFARDYRRITTKLFVYGPQGAKPSAKD